MELTSILETNIAEVEEHAAVALNRRGFLRRRARRRRLEGRGTGLVDEGGEVSVSANALMDKSEVVRGD